MSVVLELLTHVQVSNIPIKTLCTSAYFNVQSKSHDISCTGNYTVSFEINNALLKVVQKKKLSKGIVFLEKSSR